MPGFDPTICEELYGAGPRPPLGDPGTGADPAVPQAAAKGGEGVGAGPHNQRLKVPQEKDAPCLAQAARRCPWPLGVVGLAMWRLSLLRLRVDLVRVCLRRRLGLWGQHRHSTCGETSSEPPVTGTHSLFQNLPRPWGRWGRSACPFATQSTTLVVNCEVGGPLTLKEGAPPLRCLRCALRCTLGIFQQQMDGRFIVMLFTMFCTLHPSTMCRLCVFNVPVQKALVCK